MTLKGVVDWWSDQKRFGFITPEDLAPTHGEKVLAQYFEIKTPGVNDLKAGDKFQFVLTGILTQSKQVAYHATDIEVL